MPERAYPQRSVAEDKPKQKTKPKKGKPVEIPVPKRGDIERVLKRATKPAR
jgi:hypothetical protein